jgi:hypothetical protein
MIPKVFVSSTMYDLQYLRDAVRQAIVEIGLEPVMSEHSEVAFTPSDTVENACYKALQECHLAVVIVGKRYGTLGKDGISVTHNEFRVARDRKVPTFCLVDKEVLAFKRVFDHSVAAADVPYPGMEAHDHTFRFVREIAEARPNNAILSFESAQDARTHLRSQIAHLFQELLVKHNDPLQAEIRDVLAEVRALKHGLVKDHPAEAKRLLKSIRLLLDEEYEPLRELLEQMRPAGALEDVIPEIISSASFPLAAEKITGKKLVDVPEAPTYADYQRFLREWPGGIHTTTMRMLDAGDGNGERVTSFVAVTSDGQVLLNSAALANLDDLHSRLLAELA